MWRSVRFKAILVVPLLVPTAAVAQGFLDSLFGGGGQQQSTPAPSPQAPPVQPLYGYRAPLFNPYRQSQPSDGGGSQSRAGNFQTVCVRMCDGYYFPISNGVSRSTFHRDANRCRSSCGEEARLFYRASSEPDAAQMVDLTGRVYAKLPNAFKYRKSLVEGCTCKPEPWSVSEMDRHRRYAANETIEQQKQLHRSIAETAPAPAAMPSEGEPKVAEVSEEKSEIAEQLAQVLPEPSQRPVDASRPRMRRAEARPEPRPIQPRPVHSAVFAKPVAAPSSGGLFGGGGSKLRWPGD